MRVFVCGDIVPGGVLPYQEEYISNSLRDYMSQFDFRIGTLECAVGNGLPYDEEKMRRKMNIIYVRNEDLSRIKEMGFDVVSLANNHVWDMGVEGLKNTIRQLEKLGIQYCGAGMNIEEASRPAVVTKDGLSVAFLAYCEYDEKLFGHIEVAGKDKPGLCPLDINKIVEDIRAAKKKYDKVVVMPHWGKEYTYAPMPESVEMARQMIKAGADAVMGGHSHQVQPMVRMNEAPVCFCMGNFLFPDFYVQPPRPMWYPETTEDLTKIPDIDRYIFPIKEHSRRVWKPLSRYGRAVELTIDKESVSAKSHFTYTTSQNIVSDASITRSMKWQLWKNAAYIKFPPYRLVSDGKRRFKSMLKRKNRD